MALDNSVTITGNATREPELRFTPSGQAVANFGVAVNRRWQNRQTQEWEESVSFFDVTCWATLAENVAESVAKGTRVTVTGRLDQRSWETPEGDKRSKVEIVADDVAVSLRWATAEVLKNERSDGAGGYGGGRTAAAGSGNAGSPPPYNPDEEPF
ncbi:MAG: single-stranded DNA-binding protein [Acidimicrobiia bacterium]|nr:single-stranded DNA-binding protein [Acidimicrobiia bacterium]